MSLFLGRRAELFTSQIRQEIDYLRNPQHTVALVGTIGVGKTLALCEIAGLVHPTHSESERRHVLPTGSGRITLCEVRVQIGDRLGLCVTPRPREAVEADVQEWAESLLARTRAIDEQSPGSGTEASPLSEEFQRALRNMAGLNSVSKARRTVGKPVDPLQSFVASHSDQHTLEAALLERLRLEERTERMAWFDGNDTADGLRWLSQLILDINNGKNPQFPLPEVIDIIVPPGVIVLDGLDASDDGLQLKLTLIDTKGIDHTAARADIEVHLKDERTVTLLCSRFNDAPQSELQTLLRRAVEAGISGVDCRSGLLVLAHAQEPLDMRDDCGEIVASCEEGYEIRREQILVHLRDQGLPNVPITFYDACTEGTAAVRQFVTDRVRAMRAQRARTLCAASRRANEMLAQVEEGAFLRQVTSFALLAKEHLEACAKLPPADRGGEAELLSEISGARYAAWLRAAVRRKGSWDNFDFVHHFVSGSRFSAVRRITVRVRFLKQQFRRLAAKPEFEMVADFCAQLESELDRHASAAINESESFAHELVVSAFSGADADLWFPAIRQWGARSLEIDTPYKERIRGISSAWFREPQHEGILRAIDQNLESEWRRVIERLHELVNVAR